MKMPKDTLRAWNFPNGSSITSSPSPDTPYKGVTLKVDMIDEIVYMDLAEVENRVMLAFDPDSTEEEDEDEDEDDLDEDEDDDEDEEEEDED